MKLAGFSLMRVGGINIVIDYSWIVMFFVVSIIARDFFTKSYPNYGIPFYWAMGGIVSVLVFLSVLARELAHSFAATKLGAGNATVRLHIFGAIYLSAQPPRSGRHEFVIALAGWAVSAALAGFFLAIYAYFGMAQQETPVRGVAACLMSANIILTLLHMIPGFPLVGGSILRAVLWDRWNDIARATRVVSRIGSGLALFFIIFGILQFLVTQSLLAGLLFIVGLFMKLSAMGTYQSVVERHVLADVPVRQVMQEQVAAVDWLISVEELVRDHVYKHRYTHFPVLNRDELVGMVSLDAIKSVAKDLWTFKQVRDIMAPIESVVCALPDSPVSEALNKMDSDGIGCMPVMENDRMVGFITRSDIMNFFRIKSDLGNS